MNFDDYTDNFGRTANDNTPHTIYSGADDSSSHTQNPNQQADGVESRSNFYKRAASQANPFAKGNSKRIYNSNGSKHYEPTPYDSNRVTNKTSVKSEKRDEGMALAIILWLGSIGALIWTFLYDLSGNQQLLASTALICMGLWVGYLGQDRQRKRLGDLGTFTSILGFVSALMAASMKMNIPLSLADCISVLTLVCLICSMLSGSRIALILSACSALFGVFLHFQGQVSPYAMIAFPAIWSTQLYQASKLRSFLATLGVILVGYYWVFGFTLQFLELNILSAKYASTLIFLFGAFQYRTGKAAEDEHAPYAMIHMLMGWCVACIGAMATQACWMYPELIFWNNQNIDPQVRPTALEDLSVWIGLGGAMLIGIFFANLVRWKNNRLALSSVFAITLLCMAFAFTTVFETQVQQQISTVSTSLSNHHIGFAIGAGIMASAIAMAVNGARWQKLSMICTASTILGAQLILLFNPDFFTLDDGVIFGALLLLSLCITTALSGRAIGNRVDLEARSARLNA